MGNKHSSEIYSGWLGGLLAWFMSSWIREVFEKWNGEPFSVMSGLLELSGSETILDAGCGSGFYSIRLARLVEGGMVIGVDSSPQMLAALSSRSIRADVAQQIEAKRGEVMALPVEEESVDRAICTLVWHYLEDPAPAARELFRVLRHDGKVVVADFLVDGSRGLIGHRRLESGRLFTKDQMRQTLEDAGFVNVSTQVYGRLVIGAGEKK